MNNIHIDTIFMAERKLLCARHIGPYQGIGAAFEKLERELSRLGLRADAILDRLVHNAHRIALAGESMRKKNRPPLRLTRRVLHRPPTASVRGALSAACA